MEKELKIAGVVAAAYAGLQLISNIASLKVGVIGGFAVDMGTFCYPLTFTIRDIAHKRLGKNGVTALVWFSAVLSLFASLYLALAAKAPSVTTNHFDLVFTPMWRIVIASIIAMLVSELVDTQIYHISSQRKQTSEIKRVLLSNLISIPIDNLLFAILAFAFTYSWREVWQIFFFNLIVKYITGILGAPLVYLAPQKEE